MGFVVAAFAFLDLMLKAPSLFLGVVEFAEAVGDFHFPRKDFETLYPVRLVGLVFGER